jgi:hypothetical protein
MPILSRLDGSQIRRVFAVDDPHRHVVANDADQGAGIEFVHLDEMFVLRSHGVHVAGDFTEGQRAQGNALGSRWYVR